MSKPATHVYVVFAHASETTDAELLNIFSKREIASAYAFKHQKDDDRYICVLKKSVKGPSLLPLILRRILGIK